MPFWDGTSVLLTGASGLVGKTMLAKLVLGEIGRPKEVFVLLREKKGEDAQTRLQNILASPLFDGHRELLASSGMLVALPGDLSLDGLGIPLDMRARVVASCTVVLSCAASVDFNEPLLAARNTNVLGALRVLDLAVECHARPNGKGLCACVHVSTCYVNANKLGEVEERLYPPSFDPESFLQMPDDELTQRKDEICEGYPNTYTFSKSMAEQLLRKRALGAPTSGSGAKLPFVLVRPSIIGSSWRWPKAGWVDTVLAVGAVVLASGLGVVRAFRCNAESITDIVPLDTVVDAILGAAVCVKNLKAEENSVPVVHAGTSDLKPIRWAVVRDGTNSYWMAHPSSTKQVRKPKLYLDPTGKGFDREMMLLGVQVKLIARLCCCGDTSKNLAKVRNRCIMLDTNFRFFSTREWIFKAPNLALMPKLLQKAKEPAQAYGGLELSELNWYDYVREFSYGLRRFVLKEEDAEFPEPTASHPVLQLRKTAEGTRDFYLPSKLSTVSLLHIQETISSASIGWDVHALQDLDHWQDKAVFARAWSDTSNGDGSSDGPRCTRAATTPI